MRAHHGLADGNPAGDLLAGLKLLPSGQIVGVEVGAAAVGDPYLRGVEGVQLVAKAEEILSPVVVAVDGDVAATRGDGLDEVGEEIGSDAQAGD